MMEIQSMEDMCRLIEAYGFLPFFRNEIEGFSIEEHTPAALWYNGSVDGRDDWPVWDWKGPVIGTGVGMYGKLFRNKAGFVSLAWVPDFLNVRRGGMRFYERCEEGLVYYKDRAIMDTVSAYGSILTPHLKAQCNYRKGGNTGFESAVTRLQMQGFLCIADFVYRVDRHGREYGWGVARYTTPEAQFGEALADAVYGRTPEESLERIRTHLSAIQPHATARQIDRMIGAGL